ncbi:MAG: hypothetical protein SGJ11_12210 [Phycisphaerae bacterium]|nr:hypothetical protein [Phycisphaerae bacterium]
MSQMNSMQRMSRRSDGEMDVYTGLLAAALLVLLLGIAALAIGNSSHSDMNNQGGGPFTVVD